MANWGKILSRGNVEDRRSLRPAVAGGVSIAGVVLYLVVNTLMGGDLQSGLNDVGQAILEQQGVGGLGLNDNQSEYVGDDPYEIFASTVLGSTNDTWNEIFTRFGEDYPEPKLVLFRQATQSSCGLASSDVGPHYCSLDNTIYLDETFFDELTNRFGARGGDVAEAYVISHEVGHHVQNVLGDLDTSRNNQSSVQLELQADCYAGIWANSIRDQGVFELDEIREAMDAAAAVGDDRIQERVLGYSDPESFTHGSSEDRVRWFTAGYNRGDINACSDQ